MSEPIAIKDVSNHFLISRLGDSVVIPVLGKQLRRDRALNLAAWLVALADDDDQFTALLEAVRNTYSLKR